MDIYCNWFMYFNIYNLIIELINTDFICNSITVEGNLFEKKSIPLSFNCFQSQFESITSITFSFPSHQSTVKINMTGPYWIGAIRLCIRGKGHTNKNNILRQLDFCQLYNTSNSTIARTTFISILFIKNIQQPIVRTAELIFHGLLFTSLCIEIFAFTFLIVKLFIIPFCRWIKYKILNEK